MSTISASTTSTTAFKITTDTTGALVFQTGASPTTAMTLDTSQNTTLAGNIRLNNGTADGAQLSLASSGYSDWNIDNYSGNFRWYYNATEYMRLDASGNLGVGVSPSAKFNIGSGGAARFNRSDNATYGEIFYGGAGVGMKYLDANSDGHRFFNGATQAMTLDASGNLGLGTTTPNVAGGTRAVTLDAPTAGNYSGFELMTGGTLRAKFIGNSSQTYLGTNTATPLVFVTNDTEAARIDSSGNLLVGATGALNSTSLGRINSQNTTLPAFVGAASSSSFTGNTLLLGSGTTAGTGFNHIACYVSTGGSDQFVTGVFFVRGNGNTVNTNNSYGAISDVKLKENIVDATPKLAQLNQVRIVNYNLIGSEQKQLGVIAQELEQIFPSMVDETVDRDTEGNDLGTTTKQVKYSVFVPMLIKAIQELNAKVTALENK